METNNIRTWYVYKEVPKHEVSFVILLDHAVSMQRSPNTNKSVESCTERIAQRALIGTSCTLVTDRTPEKSFDAPSRDLRVPPPLSKLSLHFGCLHRTISARGAQKTGLLVPTMTVLPFRLAPYSSPCPSSRMSQKGQHLL